MKPEGGKPRRHQERAPRILQMFGYLAVTFSLLLKKQHITTESNIKQLSTATQSNIIISLSEAVFMDHPIALISQQIRYGLKLAKHWPKIGQQRSLIGFILYLEM